jgi:predicted nucleotidyltransferase
MKEREMALNNLIYKIRIGSTMYGTIVETSDEDLSGIFIPDQDYVLGIKKVEQVELSEKISKTIRNQKGDTDYVVYSLTKIIPLLIANNPNIIEFLFAPESCVLLRTQFSDELINNRHLFLSKKAYHTFKGYAYAQRQKLIVKREHMTGRIELSNKYGYDVKFASHLIRLLLECLQLLTEKSLTFPLSQNNLIRDIKIGKYELSWILEKAEYLEKLIDEAYIKSDLQYSANIEEINKLQIKLLKYYWDEKGEIK